MSPFTCSLQTYGVLRASSAEIASMRRDPDFAAPNSVKKHADAQAVLGVAAALLAVRNSGRPVSDFAEWGVTGAPRYFARIAGMEVLRRLRTRGVSSVSPQISPQYNLHSLAGNVSISLGSHGPVTGLGGCGDALSDGFWGGISFLHGGVPGMWIVLTAYDPEPTSAEDDAALCHAVALGMTATPGVIRLEPGDAPALSVASLGRFLENDLASLWQCSLLGGWRLSLAKAANRAAKAA